MPFQEIQYGDWWLYAIVVGVGVLLPLLFVCLARYTGQKDQRLATRALLTVAPLLFLLSAGLFASFGKMTTEVSDGQVQVTFGWLPVYTWAVPLDQIQSVDPVEYEPMADYNGWGIRGREGDRALTIRGHHGVRLKLADGSKLLIGSDRPDDLAAHVQKGGQ